MNNIINLKNLCKGVVLFFYMTTSCVGQENYTLKNELGTQTSPYLLQHANNPVAWKSWGLEVFEKSIKLDRLIVISVGYASCHWCHVMEEESFEDSEVAAVMNEGFINIKVDREERPDIDQIYMTALRLMGTDGGWPLNVIALPDGSPIYAGTYHSKVQWISALKQMKSLYALEPEKLRVFAADLKKGIVAENAVVSNTVSSDFDLKVLEVGLSSWKTNWDLKWGGNTGDQKFMRPNGLIFLLDYGLLSGNPEVLKYVFNTLDLMANGSIYDQLQGGFFRYSTDSEWKIPHFEKMLYDNGQMVKLYAKAYKTHKNERYKELVYQSLNFLKSEMKSIEGGYIAAIDADLDGEEGAYYRWTPLELKALITSDWSLFAAYYSLDATDLWEGKYQLLQRVSDDLSFALTNGVSIVKLREKRKEWESVLWTSRSQRGSPIKDTKIITSWNALLVEAYAEAFQAFGEEAYLEEAQALYSLLLQKGVSSITHVLSEEKEAPVFSEDYAFLAKAALTLYLSTAQMSYLEDAKDLMNTLDIGFYNDENGLYQYSVNETVIAPITKMADGVIPSDNAVGAEVNFLLGLIRFDAMRTEKAEKALIQAAPLLSTDLNNYTQWGMSWLYKTFPFYELAIVGPQALKMATEVLAFGRPNVLVVASKTSSSLPLFQDRYTEGETLLYVCKNYACKLPVQTVKEAMAQLD
jgi:uncharacterized protein YyaL (SSP411 family)